MEPYHRATLAAWFDQVPEPKWEELLRTAMQGAARGLSELVGHAIDIATLSVETVPLSQIAAYAGDPEAEMVGVYLMLEGDLQGQAILLLPVPSALALADVLLGAPRGSAVKLGELERSALAEAGNLTVSYFLNTVAGFLGKPSPLQPSPPMVLVDMLGAILDVVVTPGAAVGDDLLIVETAFTHKAGAHGAGQPVPARFWVLPAPAQDLIRAR